MTQTLLMPEKRRPRQDFAPGTLIEERIEGAGDVFLVPFLNGFLFYSPLTNVTMILDDFGAATLRKYFRKESLDHSEQAMIDGLVRQKILPISVARRGTISYEATTWTPLSVTFSNTQKCTLRCTYCYAEGGRLDDLEIPWSVAKTAIDLIMKNAMDRQANPSIRFLGEGEATASWGVFQRIVEYFEDQCRSNGLAPTVVLNTNGVFPASRVDYLAQHCTHMTFSLDGIRDVHNQHRVLPNGEGSFDRVIAIMKQLDDLGKSYDIRSTVTAAGSETITEFVEFVGTTLLCKSIHLEPVFDVTGVTNIKGHIQRLDAQRFVERFRDAKRVAAEFGIDLHYSGAALKMRESFCGAHAASNFLVTSRGIVTSCNEVLQPTDPRATLFQYGAWNEALGTFDIDREAVDRLGKLNVQEMPKCQGCMAKYNCAGDCYAKSAATSGDPAASTYTERCHITRELLKDNLLVTLLSKAVGAQIWKTHHHECSF
ncbi:thioether cross-link-forming SCIFF peptide maturase [Nitrospira sp.]|nr:thioether cross-link-forming SCIFF peptide maturase [Nitrospira sp.]